MVYTESDLIIPTLQFLKDNPQGITTSQLIKYLETVLKPSGRNGEILAGRTDTHFSQKVRNLKSHDTLTNMEVAKYESGIWKITSKGLKYLAENELDGLITSLYEQGFEAEDIEREVKKEDLSDLIIEEGALDIRTTKQRSRSDKLKKIKIDKLKEYHGGQLFCEVCKFNFLKTYGEHGKDYIIIHHIKPVHKIDIEGEQAPIEEALKRVVPVCANCHSMIHRKRKEMLSIEELKELLNTD